MRDSKDVAADAGRASDSAGNERTPAERGVGQHAGDSASLYGWQQYRKWISSAPATTPRRGSLDPSLYTWKGYRNWAEQVKRNWSNS